MSDELNNGGRRPAEDSQTSVPGHDVLGLPKLSEAEGKVLECVMGYCGLGMGREALRELQQLSPEALALPYLLEVRVMALIQARRMREAAAKGRRLIQMVPEYKGGYIHTAFALHESGRTKEALDLLRSGPPVLKQDATYFYNVACYEAVLGNAESAVKNLSRSFRLDNRLKEGALEDRDLAAIRQQVEDLLRRVNAGDHGSSGLC
jgi:predicted Zn-dependent protease